MFFAVVQAVCAQRHDIKVFISAVSFPFPCVCRCVHITFCVFSWLHFPASYENNGSWDPHSRLKSALSTLAVLWTSTISTIPKGNLTDSLGLSAVPPLSKAFHLSTPTASSLFMFSLSVSLWLPLFDLSFFYWKKYCPIPLHVFWLFWVSHCFFNSGDANAIELFGDYFSTLFF